VINVTDVGNAAPLTEGAGASTASFTVGSMALRGAYGDGTKVGSFNAEETQVRLDEATSSAEVNMGEVSATEISSRRNSSLSSAHFNGVKVGISADASSLTAETGSINDLAVGQKFALGSAESQGLSASLDHESGVITTSSDQLDISALRAMDTTLDEASATMVQAELGPNPLQNLNMTSSLDTVTAKGLLVDDDFSATTMSGAGMTFGAKNGLLDIGAQSAAVENATTIHGTAGSASVDNLGVGVDIARGHTSVSADAVDLTAVDGNHASSGAIRTRGVTADIHNQARRFGLGVESVELDDLMTEHGSAESGTAAMLSVQHNDKDKASAVTANSVGLKGVTSDYGQAAQIDANAMSIDGQRKSGLFEGEVGFGSVSGTQLSNDYGTVDTANLGGVNISSSMVDGLRTSSTSLDTTDFQGFQSEYGSITTGDAAGLNINTHGDALGITLDSMNASGLNSQYGSAATANMLGAEFSRTNGSTDSQLGFNSARLTTVESEYVSAEMMNAAGLNIAQHEEGTALSLDTAEAANLTGPYGTTLEHGRIDGVTAHHGPEATTAQLDRTQLSSLGINSNGVNAQIAHADLNGMQGTLRGRELDTSLDNGVISGAVGTFDNVEGLGIPNSGIPYVDMSRHELDARFGLDSGTVRLGAGNTAAIQDVAGMVDNANIQATVPMLPGDLEGMATIRPDTTLQAGLRIEDGRLVTDGTGVTSSQPIDGPAWTTINGAYLKETNQGGQLNASVGGFFDQNITGQMTEGLTGKKSKHIPLEVGALAQRLSEGKDTGAPSGHLTLGKENQGDNSVRVRSNANGLAAALTRLLVSSLRMKTSNGEIEAGRTAVTDAQLSTSGTANMPSTVTGSIGQVEVESLSAKHTLSGN
ncbi:MAG: hypothetical protein VX223_18855, partial [Myxococcota bacterium]|nr:hypothetical protein [Myxococcota bacterium]